MTDVRRPRTPLGSRLGHTRAAPGGNGLRRLTGNDIRLTCRLSTCRHDVAAVSDDEAKIVLILSYFRGKH